MKEAADEAAKAKKKLKEEVDGLTASLMEEVLTFGMTSEQVKIFKLQMMGASEAELANARGLENMLHWLRENKKLMEEGARVTKEFRTPTEKFADRVKELEKMLEAGAISETTFGRAMEDAKKKLKEAEKGAKGARQEIQSFDAALVGSAEAASRIQAQRDRLRVDWPTGGRTASGGPAVVERNAAAIGGAEGAQRQEQQVAVMKEMRDGIKQLVKKPAVELKPAGLG